MGRAILEPNSPRGNLTGLLAHGTPRKPHIRWTIAFALAGTRDRICGRAKHKSATRRMLAADELAGARDLCVSERAGADARAGRVTGIDESQQR
jgi:hypothetical protein